MVDFTGFEKAKVCGGCHRCLTTEERCKTCIRIAELEAALDEAREDSARRKLDVSIETLENLKNHQRGGDYRPHVSVREINLIIGALKADRAAIDAARGVKP